MNETAALIRLRDLMDGPEGWGRAQGRAVFQKLLDAVEASPGALVYRVSLQDVTRTDISFASETVIELARRYRGHKGFFLTEVRDPDMQENWHAACLHKEQPLMVWDGEVGRAIGPQPSKGNQAAFRFALKRQLARAGEFAKAAEGMSIANASTKFKQLWLQGFLLRREDVAPSGGIEYSYLRMG